MLNSAPRKAASGTQEISPRNPLPKDKSQFGKKISPRIPPKEAPPEIPSICGQASGLRSKAWSTAPHAAMPPPIAIPKRTRGRRVRNKISALESGDKRFSNACERSTATGPSKEQPITERIKKRKRAPLTRIIFLRFRTFTCALLARLTIRSSHKTFRVNEAGKFRQGFPHSRPGTQDLVGWVRVDSLISHSRHRFEIGPA